MEVERYRLLASAIAGRPLEIGAAAGVSGFTDGETVFVGAEADPRHQLLGVCVQAALVGAGSLEHGLGSLSRRPALVRRYLSVEGHRALSVHEHLLPPAARRLIDHGVAQRSDSPERSLALARSGEALPDPPVQFGAIEPKRIRPGVAADPEPHPRLAHARRRPAPDELGALEDDEADEDAVDLLSSPVGGGGGIGRLLAKLFGPGRSEGTGSPGADSPTHWGQPGRTASRTVSTTAAPGRDVTAPDGGRQWRYPEWDRDRRRYKPDWCTVVEVEPLSSELSPFPHPTGHALRRHLGRLGMEFEHRHRQLQGDDLDIDAAVEARVELLAHTAPGEAVYIDSVRHKRDLSVLFLLDVSGSAGEPGAVGLAVHEHQRSAAAALAAALYELGDRVALYGFRSQGRRAVTIIPVKRFADDLDELVLERLGGLVPRGYTRLGAAIRHGTAVVEQEAGTARRLLVVLSDGFAYDHGYEHAYGESDARRALAEASRRGIGCLCLSIGADTDADALRRVFGTTAHAAIRRVDELPAVVGPLFRAALRSAEARRRVFVRRRRSTERLDVDRRTA